LRRWSLALALCGVLFAGVHAAVAETVLPEYQAKALFLLNFTKYVTWPADAFADTNAPITIGVYGENRFGDDLKKATAGKTAGNREIVVRQIESADDLRKCQILFISSSEKKRASEIIERVKAEPILTVGEADQFTEQGGIINFVLKEKSLRLEINLSAAQHVNLQISSKLLSVADVVKGKSR
jgi:hypothetical protein